MTAPKSSRPKTYVGVTYRCVVDGKLVEQVTVPLGGYEDTRLGLEVLSGENGWQLVDPDTDVTDVEPGEPAEAEPRVAVSNANDDSGSEPGPVAEDSTEALGQPDQHHDDKQEGGE